MSGCQNALSDHDNKSIIGIMFTRLMGMLLVMQVFGHKTKIEDKLRFCPNESALGNVRGSPKL